MDLLENNITPAEAEQSVRTYCCTYYKAKFLGIESNGFLGVTNKRLIFQAVNSSNYGTNVIQSEVPIADVSGISSFKGIYFSILHLIGALLLTGMAISLVTAVIGGLAAVLESYEAFMVLGSVVAVAALVGSLFIQIISVWRTVLASVSTAALIALGGGSLLGSFSLFGGFDASSGWPLILAGLVSIYALLCAFWYARRPTFTLQVNSKGGASTPINIASASGIGLFSISANRILNAEPAEDAEPMLRELGALVLDIQSLGDFGIAKWKIQ